MSRLLQRCELGMAALAAVLVLAACGSAGARKPLGTTSSSTTGTNVKSSTTATATTATAAITNTATVGLAAQISANGLNYQSGPPLGPVLVRGVPVNVDGIMCQHQRQLAYRRYAHLTIYVDGHQRALPGGIGMVSPKLSQTAAGPVFTASHCYYWLHTNSQDGVVAVESPVERPFTLGQLFAIWGQELSSHRLGNLVGRVVAIVDGRRWHGAPTAIGLREHATIELAIGGRIPRFQRVDWTDTTL